MRCQTDVEALRIDAEVLRAAFRASEPLRGLLLRYAAVVFSSIGRSLACKVSHPAEPRLARWLLMTHDRAGRDEFPLTHEFLAAMLGVRRASVTVAAGMLQPVGVTHEGTCGLARDRRTTHAAHPAATRSDRPIPGRTEQHGRSSHASLSDAPGRRSRRAVQPGRSAGLRPPAAATATPDGNQSAPSRTSGTGAAPRPASR